MTPAHFHALVWWRIDYIENAFYCNIFTAKYEIALQVFFLNVSPILTLVLMISVDIMMILNIQKFFNQIAEHSNDTIDDRLSSIDSQLITILFVQVVLMVLFTAAYTTVNIFDMLIRYNHSAIYNTKGKIIIFR